MYHNLTTYSFAIAKHDTCSILRKMFTQFFLIIILAVSFQSTVLADITQADLDKLGAKIIDTTHGKLSIIDINKHPQRDEILDAMTEAQFKDFSNWQVSKTKAAQERNAEKKKLLVQKYTVYIGNAEVLGKGSKKTFNEIINFNATPEALKQRTRALLADKNMKWED